MTYTFTRTQKQRLQELEAPDEFFGLIFETENERNKRFQEISTSLEKDHRENIKNFLSSIFVR